MPGLGVRALRYSMLVDDGKVTVLNVEEPGGRGRVLLNAGSSILR
jgi:peroxiredoxin